jgi:hypothetical protein
MPRMWEGKRITSVSVQIEYGRNHTYQVQEGHCQECLEFDLWISQINEDYRKFDLWNQFAESRGYDPKLLEFKPTYPKTISVKDRVYKNDEYFNIGFRMNGTDFLRTVHIYKGYIDEVLHGIIPSLYRKRNNVLKPRIV